jgi:hypothetical protein
MFLSHLVTNGIFGLEAGHGSGALFQKDKQTGHLPSRTAKLFTSQPY